MNFPHFLLNFINWINGVSPLPYVPDNLNNIEKVNIESSSLRKVGNYLTPAFGNVIAIFNTAFGSIDHCPDCKLRGTLIGHPMSASCYCMQCNRDIAYSEFHDYAQKLFEENRTIRVHPKPIRMIDVWKCSYCKTIEIVDRTDCPNCGAIRE